MSNKIPARHRAYATLDSYGPVFRNTSLRAKAVGFTFPPEEVDPILQLIQQPDPKTGFPRKDLTILFASDTNPEIREYIQRHMLNPLPSRGGTSDPDVAIDMLRHRGETDVQYIDRLSSEISSYNKSLKSSNMSNPESAD